MGFTNPMLHPTESENEREKEWPGERTVVYESDHRGSKALWGLVVLLAVALGALAYYGYQMVKDQNSEITQLFSSQGTLSKLGQRADAAESQLREMTGNWQDVGQRVTKLEGRVAGSVKETRQYAETLTRQLHEQVTAELNARTSPLDTRLRQVESEEANLRTQMTQMQASLKEEIAADQEETGRDISGIRQQAETNAHDVGALSQKLQRDRVDFELAKGQSKEIAPGIDLRVRGMNFSHQRYRGELLLTQDNRTIWLKDRSTHEPVRFFYKDGRGPYELVITDVSKKAVAGYLLVPAKPDAAASASAGQASQESGAESPARQ